MAETGSIGEKFWRVGRLAYGVWRLAFGVLRPTSHENQVHSIGQRPTANSQPTHDAPNRCATQNVPAPMSAAMGMVRTQAHTMRPATPHRTAESRRVAPTPTMAPVMVCVVETGIPNELARNSVAAPAVSAAKP